MSPTLSGGFFTTEPPRKPPESLVLSQHLLFCLELRLGTYLSSSLAGNRLEVRGCL